MTDNRKEGQRQRRQGNKMKIQLDGGQKGAKKAKLDKPKDDDDDNDEDDD